MSLQVAGPAGAAPPSFAFVLQPEFPLSAAVLASEALRCANQNRARELFRWYFVSQNGEPVRASNGLWMPVDYGIDSMPATDFVLLFEGNLPTQRNSPRLLHRLRGAHSAGSSVGGVDTAAFAFAQAGLIGEEGAVLHWEAAPAFRERFPASATRDQLYRIDGRILHCAGGVATLDLMLELITQRYGSVLATEVANALVHTPRPADAPQRVDSTLEPARRSLTDRMLALMESNLDFPLGLEEIAARLGVTARTVSRECRRRFDDPPMRLYLRVRLQAGAQPAFLRGVPDQDGGDCVRVLVPGGLLARVQSPVRRDSERVPSLASRPPERNPAPGAASPCAEVSQLEAGRTSWIDLPRP